MDVLIEYHNDTQRIPDTICRVLVIGRSFRFAFQHVLAFIFDDNEQRATP